VVGEDPYAICCRSMRKRIGFESGMHLATLATRFGRELRSLKDGEFDR
jgi:hypothetical protein